MMYLLDTDHLSIAERDSLEAFNLGRRLASVPPESVRVSIISYEEQMRGWLAYIAQTKTIEQELGAYRRLRAHVERYRQIPLVDFDEAAATEFAGLQRARVRIGTMDLKIAAIALANGATLLTRNAKDFGKVLGLRCDDWTV